MPQARQAMVIIISSAMATVVFYYNPETVRARKKIPTWIQSESKTIQLAAIRLMSQWRNSQDRSCTESGQQLASGLPDAVNNEALEPCESTQLFTTQVAASSACVCGKVGTATQANHATYTIIKLTCSVSREKCEKQAGLKS